jgi:hypothetical protein
MADNPEATPYLSPANSHGDLSDLEEQGEVVQPVNPEDLIAEINVIANELEAPDPEGAAAIVVEEVAVATPATPPIRRREMDALTDTVNRMGLVRRMGEIPIPMSYGPAPVSSLRAPEVASDLEVRSRPSMDSQRGPNAKDPQRKLRLPRNFTGKEEMWEDYLKYFDGIALWNRWSEDDKARGLYLALDGSAANYIYSQPDCETAGYDELCATLEIRFGADRSVALDKKKLKERKREKGESYADVGHDMLRLARRVYKDAPDHAEKEARDHFLRSLSPQLKLAVAARGPTSMKECVDIVNKMCVMLDLDEDSSEFKRVRRVENKPQAKRGGQWSGPKKSGQSGGTGTDLYCWDCGKSGHRRNKCPEHFKFKPKGGNASSAPPEAEDAASVDMVEEEATLPKENGSQ